MSDSTERQFQIYFTSDTHGYLFPVDYATGNKNNTGFLSCAKNFKKDGNTLIIDGGDTIQGSPFASYVQQFENIDHHPIAEVFNQGRYDYITLGNHDFNYGQDSLKSYLNSLDAKCICANVAGDLPITSTDVKVLENGLRIGLVGVVTSHVNVWEEPEHLEGLEIGDPFEAAKAALENLRGVVDVTICIYHGGFECDLHTGVQLTTSTEHIASRICKELDFDLLLTGHQHMPIEGMLVSGTYVVQPQCNAAHYINIEGTATKNGFRFTSKFHKPDGDYNEIPHLTAIESKVKTWLDQPVGFLDKPLHAKDKLEMALNGTGIADFFNQVQLAATNAQISCTSLANDIVGFEKSVSWRDIIVNYPYSDTLRTLEVSGETLKLALERTASYFDLDENGKPIISSRFLLPKIEHYNYDYFANLTYTADLRKPVGERVTDILYKNIPVKPTNKFTICMTQYRATGTGGYEMYADCPVVFEGVTELSEVIQQYLKDNERVAVPKQPAPNFIF